MYHLAQMNLARLRYSLDDPRIEEFVKNLDRINALAEVSKGFVWRLKDESGNATDIEIESDPQIIINMSVWETLNDLKAFVYQSEHLKIMQKRRSWFERMSTPNLVLWWLPRGVIPTIEDARSKLKDLSKHGETPRAFTFAKPFSSP